MYIIIVGAGKLGYQLAEMFSFKQNNVVLVDVNAAALTKASANLDVLTVHANGLSTEVLKQLKIDTADMLIAVSSSDETNMLLSTIAKKLGCPQAIARIRTPEHSGQLDFLKTHFEINYVSNPDYEIAREIMKYLVSSEATTLEDFAKGRISMVEFKLEESSELIDKAIMELDLPRKMLIVGITRDGELIIPNGNTKLLLDDILYLLGVKEEVYNFKKTHGHPIKKRKIKSTIILGGGNSAFYLTQLLVQTGVSVKIIEQNKERCKQLAQSLPDALIIHGDASDLSLLEEENLSETDALVLLTGFDEENILLSMIAKKQGVEKVITKVSRPNYVPLIEKLGIEAAVNPILITASGIMRHVQGGRLLSMTMLLGGQAEVMEIIVDEDSAIVDKPLKDINLPEGLIIGAFVRKGKVFIPDGQTEIEAGDRVVVFCSSENSNKIDSYFYKKKRGFFK